MKLEQLLPINCFDVRSEIQMNHTNLVSRAHIVAISSQANKMVFSVHTRYKIDTITPILMQISTLHLSICDYIAISNIFVLAYTGKLAYL